MLYHDCPRSRSQEFWPPSTSPAPAAPVVSAVVPPALGRTDRRRSETRPPFPLPPPTRAIQKPSRNRYPAAAHQAAFGPDECPPRGIASCPHAKLRAGRIPARRARFGLKIPRPRHTITLMHRILVRGYASSRISPP